jgi:hypothetical protein
MKQEQSPLRQSTLQDCSLTALACIIRPMSSGTGGYFYQILFHCEFFFGKTVIIFPPSALPQFMPNPAAADDGALFSSRR